MLGSDYTSNFVGAMACQSGRGNWPDECWSNNYNKLCKVLIF